MVFGSIGQNQFQIRIPRRKLGDFKFSLKFKYSSVDFLSIFWNVLLFVVRWSLHSSIISQNNVKVKFAAPKLSSTHFFNEIGRFLLFIEFFRAFGYL